MKKGQIISIDFIMTFVVYVFALSVFIFLIRDEVTSNADELDMQAELLYSKIDQFNDDVDFLDGSVVDINRLNNFTNGNDPLQRYLLLFNDFENAAFQRIDYCIYFEKQDGDKHDLIKPFSAKKDSGPDDYSNYNIIISKTPTGEEIKCGVNSQTYPDVENREFPVCKGRSESIVLSKPVIYAGDIVNMKILICAKRT